MGSAVEGSEVEMVDFDDAVSVAPNWQLVWWRFKKHRLAFYSGFIVILIVIIAIFPGFFSTQDPNESETRGSFIPPQSIHFWDDGPALFSYAVVGKRNQRTLKMEWVTDENQKVRLKLFGRGYEWQVLGLFKSNIHLLALVNPDTDKPIHLIGTDRLGRDQWSRVLYGTQVSLSIGLLAVFLSTVIGIFLGGISGYFGGILDMVIQRLIELLQSIPPIPIWLALSASLPRDWSVIQGYIAITTILALLTWTGLAREVRGRFLVLREEDFVIAAKMSGCGQMRVVFRHMLPTMSSHIIAAVTLAIPVMIINETFLSFLGLGLRPPAISWGVLLQEASNLQSVALAPWLLLPGVAVIVTVITLNILGDGLRDAADPYH
ncbi:MAG TPA: peptide ABC transporter permease [Rhodobacteraceae bacterium]|jgi:peptide/nickel transport system permease protein|nr:peptide ABC transporter permease [Paracoccaceae bacterium]